ncbi:DUF1176 domain-containing protein [Mesorhizobium sp. KR1-2]|uniref:DUF1176 domain-containing protein n=1 Tax=Mesorhizobium sp. KR1-2 TaxID=3156609 RepID=UPI0032B40126
MKRLLPAVTASTMACSAALAAEPAYLDNRSDATSLVRSFYNAVSRHEYARAWSYFGEAKPTQDFQDFVDGLKDTEEVRVVVGEAGSEGAAGSVYYYVPVAVLARAKEGGEKVFAGCYTARLANPQLQAEPPFVGLHIEKGDLKASDKPLEESLPASCGDVPAPAPKDTVLEQAKAAFAATHVEQCNSLAPGQPEDAIKPEDYTITYHDSQEGAAGPERKARLFRFFCTAGAYNQIHVYYLADDARGVRELHFATPELDIHYENNNPEGAVEAINIIGFRAENALINSSYDEQAHTITSNGKWRAKGDASSNGTWLFRNGDFSLVQYDVDATYDGIVDPQTILDYNSAP